MTPERVTRQRMMKGKFEAKYLQNFSESRSNAVALKRFGSRANSNPLKVRQDDMDDDEEESEDCIMQDEVRIIVISELKDADSHSA